MANGIMPYRNWVRICLFNILLVAIAGSVMRYKIAYSLPMVNQKNLLHAHSHFAFSGWVMASLYTIIVSRVFPNGAPTSYRRMFILLLGASYGMLFSFPFMGYALPSIFFSTLTIAFSYVFTLMIWRKLDLLGSAALWIRTGLICSVLSSIGTFALAYLMQQKGISQEIYIGSVYFFLHFQYNGLFFFVIAGLFFHWLSSSGIQVDKRPLLWAWRLFAVSIIPGYFLSALWMRLPFPLYMMALFAAVIQVPAFFFLIRAFPRKLLIIEPATKLAWGLSLCAVSIKILLQLLSCIPALSVYAFGYRPLVIAYLHLVLLGFVTLFILGYFFQVRWLEQHKQAGTFYLFVTGVILNEILLIMQGLGAIGLVAVPYTNIVLFAVALVMVAGAGAMSVKQTFTHT